MKVDSSAPSEPHGSHHEICLSTEEVHSCPLCFESPLCQLKPLVSMSDIEVIKVVEMFSKYIWISGFFFQFLS